MSDEPLTRLSWTLARSLVEHARSVAELACLMVLVEQLGDPWLAKWLEDDYIMLHRRLRSPDDVQDFKASLAKELYELRKEGEPVTVISDLQFNERLSEIYGDEDEDDEGWKESNIEKP